MARRLVLLAVGLVAGGALAAGLAASQATGQDTPRPFDGRDCPTGYSEGSQIDYSGEIDLGLTVEQARANAETGEIPMTALGASSARLRIDETDRKVFTYYRADGRTVAELELEQWGRGWRVVSSQKCALAVSPQQTPQLKLTTAP